MALNLKDAPRNVETPEQASADPATAAFELAIAIEKHLNRIASCLEIIAESTYVDDEECEGEAQATPSALEADEE